MEILLASSSLYTAMKSYSSEILSSSAQASSSNWAELSFNPSFSPTNPTGKVCKLAQAEAPSVLSNQLT